MITTIMETFFLSLNSSAPSLDFLTAATTSDGRDTNRFPLLSAPPTPTLPALGSAMKEIGWHWAALPWGRCFSQL